MRTAALALTLLALAPSRTLACSCAEWGERYDFERSSEVFEGRVVAFRSERDARGLEVGRAEVQVRRVFRGELSGTTEVRVELMSSCAIPPPPVGSTWVFYGRSFGYCARAFPEGSEEWMLQHALLGPGRAPDVPAVVPVSAPPRAHGCAHCAVSQSRALPVGTLALLLATLIARRRRVVVVVALALLASPGAAQQTIAAGLAHTCFTRDGRVACFGASEDGQLGPAPPIVPLEDVVEIDAGLLHTCARRAGGDVWCWGGNAHGQSGAAAGREPFGIAPEPTRIAIARATQLSVGAMHACVVSADARAWCWGGNTFGELGPSARSGAEPIELPVRDVVRVYAGAGVTCVDDAHGERTCFGRATPVAREGEPGPIAIGASETCAVDREGALRCDDASIAELARTMDVGAIRDVAVRGNTVCVAGERGAACAGVPWTIVPPDAVPAPAPTEPAGDVTADLASPPREPAAVRLTDAPSEHVELGASFGCITRGGEPWCWGYGAERFAGLGPELERIDVGAAIDALDGRPGENVCVRSVRGEVWCGPAVRSMRRVEGLGTARAIAASEQLGCAITEDGAAWCWARGAAAERIALPGVASVIAVGGAHACAIVDHMVWCWGGNELGQASPDDASIVVRAPVPVSRVARESGAIALRLDASRSCAELAAGGEVCWGGTARPPQEPACTIGDGGARCGSLVLPLAEPRRIVSSSFAVCVLHARGEAGCAALHRRPSPVWPPRRVPLELWLSEPAR